MNKQVFLQICGVATVFSAVCTAVAVFLILAEILFSGNFEAPTRFFLLTTQVFIFFSLAGLYRVQFLKAGTLGWVGFVLAVSGLLFNFVIPDLGLLVFLAGLGVLAATTSRTRLLPAFSVWTWFIGGLLAIGMAMLGARILLALSLLLAAFGRAWLGIAFWFYAEPLPGKESSPSIGRLGVH